MFVCFFLIMANSRVSRRRMRKTLRGWTSTSSTWSSLSLFKSFFFKLQLQSRYVPCSLNKDFARPKLIASILIQRFFLFYCQLQYDAKKLHNFMLCHEQFCFPRRQERARHLTGEAARGMRTSRTLEWWWSELMMMMAAVEIRMRTSLMAIMIRCWKWWWWTGQHMLRGMRYLIFSWLK